MPGKISQNGKKWVGHSCKRGLFVFAFVFATLQVIHKFGVQYCM